MINEWFDVTLGELLSFSNGKTSPQRSNGGTYPVYGSNGIIGSSADNNAPGNAIVIGRVGSYCGSLQFSNKECWVTDNAIIANPMSDADAKFLFYLLHTLHLNDWKTGSGQPLLNQTILSAIPAAVPAPKEQRAIAHILGTLDDKIELNRRRNQTLEEMARAIFQDWFVEFGPVRAKLEGREPYLPPELWDLFPDQLVDSELGEIPEGWEIGCLGDIVDFPVRSVSPGSVAVETPYIGLEHISPKSIALTEWGYADKVTSNKLVFQEGEFLFGKLRPYFHKVGVAPVDGICSTDIVVVAPKMYYWSSLVLLCISTDEFVAYTDQTSTGTRMPRTNWKTMSQYELCLPPEPIADALWGLTQPMLCRIVANIFESHALAAQRDTLLPKLVSGEVRAEKALYSV